MRSHIALALVVLAFVAPFATGSDIPYRRFGSSLFQVGSLTG